MFKIQLDSHMSCVCACSALKSVDRELERKTADSGCKRYANLTSESRGEMSGSRWESKGMEAIIMNEDS